MRNFVVFVLCVVVCFGANAQITQSDHNRALRSLEQNQQRQQNLMKNLDSEQQQKVREKKKPAAPETSGEEDLGGKIGTGKQKCFNVSEIALTGATVLSGKDSDKITKKYVGTCMGLVEINKLMHEVTNYYVENGYVTSRVAIPQQNLQSGKLELMVIEGTLEDIILNENDWRDELQVQMAFPMMKGKLLNLRDIEQGLDQLNRLASSNATMQLVPGSKEGGTKLVITNKINKQNRGSLGYDNSGQGSTGKNKVLTSLERDNLFGLGEAMNFGYNQDTAAHNGAKGNKVYYGGFSVPFGYWTLSQNFSHSEYLQTIYGTNQNFQASGENDSSTSKLDRVVFRNQDSKVSLNTSLKLKDNKAFIEDSPNSSSTYQLAIITGGADYTLRALDAIWGISAGYERGLKTFGARHDADNIANDASHAQFDKYTLDANVYKPFAVRGLSLAWRTIISGQYSDDTLFSSERISMGDRYTVRGFDESSLVGDMGVYSRNELMVNLPQFTENKYVNLLAGNLQPYVGLDAGMARAVSGKQANQGTGMGYMSGWAAGLRGSSEHLAFDVAYAQNIKSPAFVTTKDGEFYFLVSSKFGF